jgi:phosphate transport system protein
MAREEYQQALEGLRVDVLSMGDRALSQLADGLAALEARDDALAREVIAGDDDLNERYLDLESQCVDLLALQQPVAGDLRFVVASFKIITDLERVGDLATNLAEYAIAGGDDRPADTDRPPGVDVIGIGTDAQALLEDALAAYEAEDVAACRAIADRDDEIDTLCAHASESVVRDLIEHEAGGSDPWAVERLMDDVSQLLLTIRDIERVGDHAVNIAARTLYMVESDPALLY